MIFTNFFGIQKMASLQGFYIECFLLTSIITMTIQKTIYKYCNLYFEFSHFNLFNSICKDCSTSLRRISLLEGAQHFFGPFPQECFFHDAGHSVHSSVLMVETNCLCLLSQSCPLLATILPLNRYLKSVYRESVCWLLEQNASNFFCNSFLSPLSLV